MAGTIVVGVDGSDASAAALRWALEEGARRGATVQVVHAWHYPYVGDHPLFVAYGVTRESLVEAAQSVLDQALAQASAPRPGVNVEPVLVHDSAASALIDAAEGADLLVVGSRGQGGFSGLLLGSVSQQCASHAPCPVVIVPSSPARA